MAFVPVELKEEDRREYRIFGFKFCPEGGIIDLENDVRLFFYKKTIVMEPDDRYDFVFDYQGKVYNITIREDIADNEIRYSLIGSDRNLKDDNSAEMKSLREAVRVYGNRAFYIGRKDKSDRIKIDF